MSNTEQIATSKLSIAEGATLSALIALSKAYSVTDAPSMLGRMLRTARWPSCLAVLASIIGTGIAIKWFQDTGIHVAAFALVASVFWFRRDAFRDYYSKKRTATFLDTFSRRDQAFRYVMFRESRTRLPVTRNSSTVSARSSANAKRSVTPVWSPVTRLSPPRSLSSSCFWASSSPNSLTPQSPAPS